MAELFSFFFLLMVPLFVYFTLSTSGSDMSPLILKFRISAELYRVNGGHEVNVQLKNNLGRIE